MNIKQNNPSQFILIEETKIYFQSWPNLKFILVLPDLILTVYPSRHEDYPIFIISRLQLLRFSGSILKSVALVYGILVDMANWYICRLKESARLVWYLTIFLSLRSLCFGGMKDLNYNERHNCQQYYVFEGCQQVGHYQYCKITLLVCCKKSPQDYYLKIEYWSQIEHRMLF